MKLKPGSCALIIGILIGLTCACLVIAKLEHWL